MNKVMWSGALPSILISRGTNKEVDSQNYLGILYEAKRKEEIWVFSYAFIFICYNL
jgi:hypothetical protein